jgi:phage terminase large subunit
MTGQTISSLKRNVLDDLTKMFGIDTHLNMANEFEMYGNKIACFGSGASDSYKSMHGLTSAGWYGNEVTLSHQNTILEGFARCSDKEAKIVWETNPDRNSHFIKTDYINQSGSLFEDGKHNILSYHFQLEDNTFLDKNYIESVKKSIPIGTYYDRMILGEWKASDKIVYKNFDIISRLPDLSKVDDYCYGLDFGWTNPTAMAKIMWIDGELYIEPLFYDVEMNKEILLQKCNRLINDKRIPIYHDIDSGGLERIATLKQAGFNMRPADKSPKSVMEGINKVREYKLHLIDSDSNLRFEFEGYELKTNAIGEVIEEPIKYKDHYCDAVRYGIFTHRNKKKGETISVSNGARDDTQSNFKS